MPLGIDLDPYLRPNEKILNHAAAIKKVNDIPLWLMVGRMTYYKGYHVAIEALSRIEGKLIIVGNGPLEQELRALAKRLQVNDRITWMASVSQENLIALYTAATALWFPSIARSEGFGLVQVEAMACGCPVINTDIPASGVSWVSQHDVSGLTVPIGNPERLAMEARRLANEPATRKRLSVGAINRAQTEFHSRLMVERSLDIYQASRN